MSAIKYLHEELKFEIYETKGYKALMRPKYSKDLFESFYNSTRIGEKIGETAIAVNLMLREYGFIKRQANNEWYPLKEKCHLCIVQVINDRNVFIRWNPSIVMTRMVEAFYLGDPLNPG